MMRFAIINENNVVVNVAVGDDALADNWIASDTALIGDIYADSVFSTPEPDNEAQWAIVRAERNKLLSDCDWTQLPDAPVDAAAWVVYRQALRDVTNQNNPFNIEWPVLPLTGE
jgi:hypothetical protein